MTLAAILLVSIFCAASAPMMAAVPVGHSAAQQAAADKPVNAVETQDQANPSQTQNPPTSSNPPASAAAPAQASSGQKQPAAAKRKRRKKKPIASNCVGAPAAATGSAPSESSASGSAPADPQAGGNSPAPSTSTPGKPSVPTNCPPSKVIVRQGGTSEPSIQLAGGAVGDQAAHQRDTANQMLGSTEENLKKMAGRQLNSKQQEMVDQIRQFMEQSKTAVTAGDLERARTLAWKAQLLSEELVKPPQ